MENNVLTIDADKLQKLAEKFVSNDPQDQQIEIKSATLKDLSCNYSYELLFGKTKGDELGRKGAHIVHDDMIEAFSQLVVFFAHIDGVFHWANNQTHVEALEAHEDLQNFSVSGFKITGSDENKAVILSGSKEVSVGTITFSTPKIKLGNSNYLYVDELTDRLQVVINEVEEYMNGKTAPQYEQLEMEFEDENDDDFENAKVD